MKEEVSDSRTVKSATSKLRLLSRVGFDLKGATARELKKLKKMGITEGFYP